MEAVDKERKVCCAKCGREIEMDEVKSITTGIHGSGVKPGDIYIFAQLSGLILDIGCGNGDKIEYFRKLKTTKEVIGLDIAEDILKARTNRICADAQYLPFKSNTFDSVICSELLEHLPNPESCIKDIHRILKPRGVVFFSTPTLNILFPILIPIFRKISGAKLEKGEHLHVFSTKRLCNIIEEHLEIVDIKYLGFTAIFNRLNLGTWKGVLDAKLSDLSKKVPSLRYFAAQAFIKGEKGGDIPDVQTKK